MSIVGATDICVGAGCSLTSKSENTGPPTTIVRGRPTEAVRGSCAPRQMPRTGFMRDCVAVGFRRLPSDSVGCGHGTPTSDIGATGKSALRQMRGVASVGFRRLASDNPVRSSECGPPTSTPMSRYRRPCRGRPPTDIGAGCGMDENVENVADLLLVFRISC